MLSQIPPLVWIALLPLLALVPAYIAHRKGYSFFLAWLLSLAVPPIALIIVLVLPKFRICRYCLEGIKADAWACRHCGRWQAATPDPLTQCPPVPAPPQGDAISAEGTPAPHKPAAPQLGKPGPRLGTGLTDHESAKGGDDRRDPSIRARRAEQTTSRRMAVGGGIVAAAILVVLTLPEIRGVLVGESDPSIGTASATSPGPDMIAGPIASAAPDEVEPGHESPALRDKVADLSGADVPARVAQPQPQPQLQALSGAGAMPPAVPMGGQDSIGGQKMPSDQDTKDGQKMPVEDPALASRDETPSNAAGNAAASLSGSTAVIPALDEVRQVQAMLTKLGYDPGPVDGVMGAKTMAALRRYQAASNQSAEITIEPTPISAPATAPGPRAENVPGPVSLLPQDLLQAKP